MLAGSAFSSDALKGRVAVVTGAVGGLGQAMVQHLAAMGAQVVQVDISHPQQAQGAEGDIRLHCDIASPQSVAEMAQFVRDRYGRCDVLVNNAATSSGAMALEDIPVDLWDRVLNVNLRGALLCAQALVPMMFERQSGSIINIASIAAQSPTRFGAYGVTKAGLRALTQQMAVEWGPRGIHANSISPGMVRTPLSEAHYRDETTATMRANRIPVRRLGQPADIASLVCFFATEASAYVNGQDIVVDGGFLKASLSNLYPTH